MAIRLERLQLQRRRVPGNYAERHQPLATRVQHWPAVDAAAEKFRNRHDYPHGFRELPQQLNLSNHVANEVLIRMADPVTFPTAFRAHENPNLSHHAAAHGDRVSYALNGLVLNATTDEQNAVLAEHPAILRATMFFPGEHDFLHQVMTAQRKIDLGERGKKLHPKTAHDMAGGLIMRAQTAEIEAVLTDAYRSDPLMTPEMIHQEAVITGILAQVISAPHNKPRGYEKVLGATKKAYTWDVDRETGKMFKKPLPYENELQAEILARAYRKGELDPFSMNQAQMNAIATYELSHPNPDDLVVDADMSNYTYGAAPHGLHPEMFAKYGGILSQMALDQTPFEDLLPKEIMDQRPVIEYMGKLALLADTYDLVSEPTERVLRSILTQKSFKDLSPRPLWPKDMTKADVQQMIKDAKSSDLDDIDPRASEQKGYSFLRRLEWEVRNWFPYADTLHSSVRELIAETSLRAQQEHFRIVRAWMHSDEGERVKPMDASYRKRERQYNEKLAKREGVAFDASWLSGERQEILDFLKTLPNAEEYTQHDFDMFDHYRAESTNHLIKTLSARYEIPEVELAEIAAASGSEGGISSPYRKEHYDVVLVNRDRIPKRGIEPVEV